MMGSSFRGALRRCVWYSSHYGYPDILQIDGSHCIASAYLPSDAIKLPLKNGNNGIDVTKLLLRDVSHSIDPRK